MGGTLNTKSSYYDGKTNWTSRYTQGQFSGAFYNWIEQLERNERAFYSKFGYSSYEEFMFNLKNFFKMVGKDVESFKAFKSSSIGESLKSSLTFMNGNFYETNEASYRIKFEVKSDIDQSEIKEYLEKMFSNLDNIKIIKSGSKKKYLTLNFNNATTAFQIKKIINQVGRELELEKKKYFKLNTKSGSIEKAAEDLGILIKEQLNIQVSKIYDSVDFTFSPEAIQKFETKGNFPYYGIGYKELQSLDKDIKKKIIDEVRKYIEKRISFNQATTYFQNAFNNVWNNNVEPQLEDDSENGLDKYYALWIKGKSITSTIGSLGEFQTALLGEYLQQTGFNKYKELGEDIIDSKISITVGNSEQAATDVNILGKFGIQVKNMNEWSARNSNSDKMNAQLLGTTMHLGEFVDKTTKLSTCPLQDVNKLIEYLTNLYFNKDIPDNRDSIAEQLRNYFITLAHFDLRDLMSEEMGASNDTITFYLISAQHLVPASIIAKMFLQEKNSIDGKVFFNDLSTAKTDDDFNQRDSKGDAFFTDFYYPPKRDVRTKFKENTTMTEDRKKYLMDHGISIQTSFNYIKILDKLGNVSSMWEVKNT